VKPERWGFALEGDGVYLVPLVDGRFRLEINGELRLDLPLDKARVLHELGDPLVLGPERDAIRALHMRMAMRKVRARS